MDSRSDERYLESLSPNVYLTASARVLLLKGFHQEGDSTFTNYKKFTADSRIIGDR